MDKKNDLKSQMTVPCYPHIVKSILCNDKIFAQFGYEVNREGKVCLAFVDCLFRDSHRFRSEHFEDFEMAEHVWSLLTEEFVYDNFS